MNPQKSLPLLCWLILGLLLVACNSAEAVETAVPPTSTPILPSPTPIPAWDIEIKNTRLETELLVGSSSSVSLNQGAAVASGSVTYKVVKDGLVFMVLETTFSSPDMNQSSRISKEKIVIIDEENKVYTAVAFSTDQKYYDFDSRSVDPSGSAEFPLDIVFELPEEISRQEFQLAFEGVPSSSFNVKDLP